ncbi:MAG: YfcC family protein [Clostridia bacterium]|nr:YfcC family protein [Clostridia bacterium]
MEKQEEKSKAFSNINARSFLFVLILLGAILALSGALSYFIPQGTFLRDSEGMIIDGTYIQGEVEGIAIWRVLTAPVRVFFSSDALTIIFISLFLLIMSGVFNLLDKTDGIRIVISKTVRKFSNRKNLVICIALLIFMAFGSFFGMFEELVTLLPIVILFMLSMGLDTLTGLGICMLGACFGFSAAITNPFSVGLASNLAGTYVLQGAWLRILFFVFVYAVVCGFLFLHIRRISKNPTQSLTYEVDIEKRKTLVMQTEESESDQFIFKVYAVFFAVQLVMLVLIASIRAISEFAIPLLSFSFLVGGITCGCFVCENKKDVAKHMGQGALSMLPAVALIAIASSVKLVMSESGILDTVMYKVIEFLRGKNKFFCIILVYFLILFLQIFIGSASAKLMLIMPIMLPICGALGLSPTVVILTYCIADGFTDMIIPTNPVLLIGLSMANVSYGKWVKWTWKLQLFVFSVTILLLMFAVQIGY